jgi:amidase
MYGCESFPVVVGPLCRSARDFEYFQTVMSDNKPWMVQPAMIPIPWRHAPTPTTLTIGVFLDDGVCRPHPPVTWAIRNLCDRLQQSSSIKVVQWIPYRHDRGYDIIRRLFFEEGGATMRKIIDESGEPSLPLTDWVLKKPHADRRTIEESWALNVEREEYRSRSS